MNPRLLALVLCCLLLPTAVLGVLAARSGRPTPAGHVAGAATGWPVPATPATGTDQPVGGAPRAVRVLRAWDARRATAWATGDPGAVADLYVAGSRAGRVERAMVASYAARGLRVTGLRMQLLGVEVVRESRRELALLVTDRLAHAVARRPGRAVVLPRDRPSTRLVVLRRTPAGWQVVEVAQPRALASTASTSGSWKE